MNIFGGEERPYDWLDKVKIEPIEDPGNDIALQISGPLELIVPNEPAKFRLHAWQRLDRNHARKIEAEIYLAGPLTVTIERLSNPLAGDN